MPIFRLLSAHFQYMRLFIASFLFCAFLALKAQPILFYTASTPCDAELKVHLGIDTSIAIDFIRWQLTLYHQKTEQGQFELKINFGVGQNNTSGFINGGEHRLLKGQYRINSGDQGPVLHLQSTGLDLHLCQLHTNLLHFLDDQNQLKIGNGGWSYCLNRQPVLLSRKEFLSKTPAFSLFEKDQLQATFDGRTPCAEMSKALDLGTSSTCIKLKWRIIFQQTEANSQAGTFVMKRIFRQAEQTNGQWMVQNQGENLVLKLQSDGTNQSMSLMQIGEGVLIFLDPQGQPYVGNADFSFGLNRKLN
jgi:hypothetical protein